MLATLIVAARFPRSGSSGLLRSLQHDGLSAQHIITLGWRGASDGRIRERLQDDQVVFLTQDEDFLLGEHSQSMGGLPRRSHVHQPGRIRIRIGGSPMVT